MKNISLCYDYGPNIKVENFDDPVFFVNSNGERICFEQEFLDVMYEHGASEEDMEELWELGETDYEIYYSAITEDLQVSYYEKLAIEDSIDDPFIREKVSEILQKWTDIQCEKYYGKDDKERGERGGFKGSIIDLPPGRGVFF